jgi:hypothetical protein
MRKQPRWKSRLRFQGQDAINYARENGHHLRIKIINEVGEVELSCASIEKATEILTLDNSVFCGYKVVLDVYVPRPTTIPRLTLPVSYSRPYLTGECCQAARETGWTENQIVVFLNLVTSRGAQSTADDFFHITYE